MHQSKEASQKAPSHQGSPGCLQDMHFTNNIFYFVMEFASGGTLVDYVRKQVGGQTALLPCCCRPPSKSCLLSGHPPRKRIGRSPC